MQRKKIFKNHNNHQELLGEKKEKPKKRIIYMNGNIKWHKPKNGYGFIEGEDGKDVFIH